MKGDVPIKKFLFHYYGFDLGATLARKILDNFLKEVCLKNKEKKHQYKNALVDIAFIGLWLFSAFTLSSNNGLDYFLCGWVYQENDWFSMGEKAIDQDSPLPDIVVNNPSPAAAHERRPWRGLYLLGKKRIQWIQKPQEELLPGCSEYWWWLETGWTEAQYRTVAGLHYAICHAACQAGVPFPVWHFGSIWYESCQLFIMNDAVREDL